jgi:hypothetical protein
MGGHDRGKSALFWEGEFRTGWFGYYVRKQGTGEKKFEREVSGMVGEGYSSIQRELKMESAAVQAEILPFLDELVRLFGASDRIDGPNKTRLFCFAVRNETTRRYNQYMAVTTQTHCSGNNPVQQNRFRVQVQTKDGKPGPDWIHGIFSVKGGGKEWWEYDPTDQKISKDIMDIVKEARKSMQR